MCMKIWLIRKIDEIELELKYMKALLIMLQQVEQATDYSDSDSDSDDEEDIRWSDNIHAICVKCKGHMYYDSRRHKLGDPHYCEECKKSKERDSDDSIRTDDVKAITDSDDETEEETLLREALEKIIEFKNKNKNI